MDSPLTGGGSSAVLDPTEEISTGDGSDLDGWYCLKGKPWSCGCGASNCYMAESDFPHRVIVWPTATDPNLLKLIARIEVEEQETGEVLPFERSMGVAVSFYEIHPS